MRLSALSLRQISTFWKCWCYRHLYQSVPLWEGGQALVILINISRVIISFFITIIIIIINIIIIIIIMIIIATLIRASVGHSWEGGRVRWHPNTSPGSPPHFQQWNISLPLDKSTKYTLFASNTFIDSFHEVFQKHHALGKKSMYGWALALTFLQVLW